MIDIPVDPIEVELTLTGLRLVWYVIKRPLSRPRKAKRDDLLRRLAALPPGTRILERHSDGSYVLIITGPPQVAA